MPYRRGWFGWGVGQGRGYYPFCRRFPWLPRWWRATPYADQYRSTFPYKGYGYPYYRGMGIYHPAFRLSYGW